MDREALEQKQIVIYFAVVIVAVIGGLAAPAAAQGLSGLITPAIAVLMYAMFLQIPFLTLKEGLGNKAFISALLIGNFVFIPLVVWVLTRGVVDHPAILIGALLALLTPCIDYVVVFTHIGKGDSRSILAATPVLLLLQLLLLPLYLALFLGDHSSVHIETGPFIEAFLVLIVAPLAFAVITSALVTRSALVRRWNAGWAWMPVPAMAGVLLFVISSQISSILTQFTQLVPVLPVYLGFLVLAPIAGGLTARLFKLTAPTARALTFSVATRNSLVVLPLALALPEDIRGLAAAAVITQTLIELVGELIYVRAIPAMIWRNEKDNN